jgi:hypothetical protein
MPSHGVLSWIARTLLVLWPAIRRLWLPDRDFVKSSFAEMYPDEPTFQVPLKPGESRGVIILGRHVQYVHDSKRDDAGGGFAYVMKKRLEAEGRIRAVRPGIWKSVPENERARRSPRSGGIG